MAVQPNPKFPASPGGNVQISVQSGIVVPCPLPPRWLRLRRRSASRRLRQMGLGFGVPDLLKIGRMGAGQWRRAAESIMRGISARHGSQKGPVSGFCADGRASAWRPARTSTACLAVTSEDVAADAPPTADAAGAPPPSAAGAPLAQPLSAGAAPVATITPVTIDPVPIPARPSTRPSSPCAPRCGPAAEAGGQFRAADRAAQPGRRRRQRLSGGQGPHHHPPAGGHHPRQSRTGGGMEYRPGPAGRPVRQCQCPECAGHRRHQ